MTTQNYEPVVVAWDQSADAFPAVAEVHHRWNGWLGAPYFERHIVDRILAAQALLDDEHETMVWSEDGRSVIVGEPPAEAEFSDEPLRSYIVEATVIDGVERWTLGSGWTWAEIDCAACEQPLTDAPYIVIDEGGDIPRYFIDIRCLDAVGSDEDRARFIDDAVMTEGHDCLDFVVFEPDPICRVCRIVLERAGSALIVPSDKPEA